MEGNVDVWQLDLREPCFKCDRPYEKGEAGWMQISPWVDEHGEHHATAILCPQPGRSS